MSVKVRLTRTGATNDVSYRIVVADSRAPRDGRFIEILGWYHPGNKGMDFKMNRDRVEHWKSKGAILSDTVTSLLKRERKAGQKTVDGIKDLEPGTPV